MTTTNNFFDNMARRGKEAASQGLARAKVMLGMGEAAPAGAGNPNVAGTGSAEAKAFRSSGAGSPKFPGYTPGSPMAPVKAPTGLGGMAAKVGRGAGPVGALVEGYDAAKNISAGENPLKSVGRAALRGGATMLGGAGGAAIGTLGGPVGTLAGGATGAYAGYKVGDAAAESIFGPAPGSAGAVPQAQAATNGQPPISGGGSLRAQPASPGRDDMVDLVGGNRATPEAAMGISEVPVAGQGAFKRTTPGNVGQAQKVGGGLPDGGVPAPTTATAQSGLREVPVVQGKGLYASKAAGMNAKLASESRGQDVTRESNITQRQLQLAQLGHTMGNENEKRVDARTDNYARGKVPVPSGITMPGADKDYENAVKAKGAEIKGLIAHSLSERKDGRTAAQLSPEEHSQLLLYNDMREKINDARSGLPQSIRDFFGNKRFDSRNLYSYAPNKVEPAVNGGYLVSFGNGNTAEVKIAGGQFNVLGPNGPIDSNIMELIKPAIQKYEASQGAR